MIAQPSAPVPPPPPPDDSFLELLAETLAGVEENARGLFLQRFFRNVAQLNLTEAQSLASWNQILQQQQQLSDGLGRRVSLKTAMMDVLVASTQLRLPILVEYDEFRKLQINAATDGLTGLYNRRLFNEYCDNEVNRARRYNQQLAVVILDLHRLKEVNDRNGHLKGDEALRLAATTLRKTLRASDLAFRIGGDEFALLLPETDPEQAAKLCKRVRALYESQVPGLELDMSDVTLDFGVAVLPNDGEEKEGLLRLADERLYQLKFAGRVNNSRVIPIEAPQARESAPREAAPREATPRGATAPPAKPAAPGPVAAPPSAPGAAPIAAPRAAPKPEPSYAERRKWERVSLVGTRASATLSEPQKTAMVLDLSYGGVALLVDDTDELPPQFYATLHVPILPPVRVCLKQMYSSKAEGGRLRVGCAFIS
jgi:diguanylate cyclase (GGDEF)-like protein